jgi:4-hydroxy-tetrahydrodipicolinate reductase
MGRLIEQAAIARGHSVVLIVDPAVRAGNAPVANGPVLRPSLEGIRFGAGGDAPSVDVAIEFSHPSAVVGNIKALIAGGVPTIVGTTGWHDHLAEVEAAVKAADGSLLWSSNYSIGVRLFLKLAAAAAAAAAPYPEYDIGGYESHHNKKADSPSGTAKAIVDTVLAAQSRKTAAVYDKLDRPPAPHELHYASLRVGSDPGTHTLTFDSDADTIEIKHTARNREGFANGAIRAAEWLVPNGAPRRGLFTMDDVL